VATAVRERLATLEKDQLAAASYLECGIILDNQRDPVISRSLDELLAEADIVVEPLLWKVDED
jgi:ribonuclease VapC